jgi:hypothetical protein
MLLWSYWISIGMIKNATHLLRNRLDNDNDNEWKASKYADEYHVSCFTHKNSLLQFILRCMLSVCLWMENETGWGERKFESRACKHEMISFHEFALNKRWHEWGFENIHFMWTYVRFMLKRMSKLLNKWMNERFHIWIDL